MSTDNYRVVLFNDGEEITFQDLIGIQSTMFARLMDQIIAGGGPAWDASDVDFVGQSGGGNIQTGPYAYALTPGGACFQQGTSNNKIALSSGTLLQKVANADGLTAQFIPFTFPGGDIATIANGDPTNPRVDIVQMALSYVDGDVTTVNALTTPVKATLDLSTLTTHDNTVVRAKVAGGGGNNVSINLTPRSSGTGVTYSENGNVVTILYESGVSTVLNVENAIIANSTLLEIQSAGIAANVLTDPADTVVSAHLAGGLNALVVPNSLNKTRKIQATITVKQGTPAASPAYPTPDTGCVVIAGVVVGASYVGASPFTFNDSAGAVAVLHDQRMPIRIRSYQTFSQNFIYPDSSFPSDYLTGNRIYVIRNAVSGTANIWMPLKLGPGTGRLIQVACSFANPSILSSRLARFDSNSGSDVELNGASLNDTGAGSGVGKLMHSNLFTLQNVHTPAAGPTVLHNANGMGPPIWTSGYRGPVEVFRPGISGSLSALAEFLTLKYQSPPVSSRFMYAVFYVAGGL